MSYQLIEVLGGGGQMLTVGEVSDYFLGTFDGDAGDNISPLKLQKLLYYAQGFHAGMHDGVLLFDEPLLAWDHGPVVASIYHKYKHYVWQAIDKPRTFDIDEYLPEDREILDAVINVYGQFMPKRLEDMTHREPPWIDAYQKTHFISNNTLTSYFQKLVEGGKNWEAVDDHPIWPTNTFQHQRRKAIASRFQNLRQSILSVAKPIAAAPNPWEHDD